MCATSLLDGFFSDLLHLARVKTQATSDFAVSALLGGIKVLRGEVSKHRTASAIQGIRAVIPAIHPALEHIFRVVLCLLLLLLKHLLLL